MTCFNTRLDLSLKDTFTICTEHIVWQQLIGKYGSENKLPNFCDNGVITLLHPMNDYIVAYCHKQ